MKKVLVFSCTVQGLKKLSPIVKKLASVDGILLKLVVCGRLEVEYCKAEGIAYHRVDEYSSLTRMADWDTDLAIDALQYLLDQETPDLLLTIDSGGFMESMFHYCKKRNILARCIFLFKMIVMLFYSASHIQKRSFFCHDNVVRT